MIRIAFRCGIAVLLIALPVTATAARAKPADCRFVFEGQAYIDGSCEQKTADDGSFQIEADGYKVQLDMEGEGQASGHWNGDVRASHLQQPLHGEGTLTQKDGCWSSRAVQLCVWQPGERKDPKPVKLPRQEARELGAGPKSAIGSWTLVAVATGGKFDHCYGFVPGDIDNGQGPLKLMLLASGKWAMSAPAAGTEPGYKSTFDIGYRKASGSIDGEVDASGQRMNLVVAKEVLEGLAASADISLGYAPDLIYRLKKTSAAIKKLQECRAQFLKKW